MFVAGWTLYVLASGLIGTLFGQPRAFVRGGREIIVSPWLHFSERGVRWATAWVALVLLTRWLSARYAWEGPKGAVGLIAAGLGLGVLTIAYLNLFSCLIIPWGRPCAITPAWFAERLTALPGWLTTSVALLLAWNVAAMSERFAEDDIRANRVGAELANAQLTLLTIQLRPHFLFNTLQSIAALIHSDPDSARRMIFGLSELFSRSVNLSESSVALFEDEMDLLCLYTDIEAVRFGGRLKFRITADSSARRAVIPHLLLQPLVENSIHHAVAQRGEGIVSVSAHVDEEQRWLTLSVSDNGCSTRPRSSAIGTGIGLANTRARLETLYASQQSLVMEHSAGGMTVRMRFPYVTDASSG